MEPITLKISILKPVSEVWKYYTSADDIVKWNFANDHWHCPKAESNVKEGGNFSYRMEAKDGSFGFDLKGIFDEIQPEKLLKYHLEDGRNVEVLFNKIDENQTEVVQTFEPEKQNPVEMQREGWYKILDNFHKYSENK